jgi:hypothetical protein
MAPFTVDPILLYKGKQVEFVELTYWYNGYQYCTIRMKNKYGGRQYQTVQFRHLDPLPGHSKINPVDEVPAGGPHPPA